MLFKHLFPIMLVAMTANYLLSPNTATACQLLKEQLGEELHLAFPEGVDIKVGLDQGKPAAKLRLSSSFETHEYQGHWVQPGQLIKLDGYRLYWNDLSNQEEQRLIVTLYAFLDNSNTLRWLILYSGQHLSAAAASVVTNIGSGVTCEELTETPSLQFEEHSDLALIKDTIESISDDLLLKRLGG